MSEQNILNPSPSSSLNPDYTTPIKVTDPQIISRFQARSGKPFFRRLAARGEVFDLVWSKRLFVDYQALRQWWKQYENDFFTFVDWDMSRYYTGMFADQPTAERAGNNQVNITAQFVVVPTLPQYIYPSDWTHDAVFIDERANWPVPNGASAALNDLVKLTGVWDHRDQNYCLQSQDFENAAWNKQNGLAVTADQVAAPDGSVTADLITSGNAAGSAFYFQFIAFPETYTVSIHVRAGTATSSGFGLYDLTASAWVATTAAVLFGAGAAGGSGPTVVSGLNSAWTRVSLTSNAVLIAGHQYGFYLYAKDATANTLTNYMWGSQIEIAPSATTYTATTSATVTLAAPTSNANYHNGFAYVDSGTITTDAAEWIYFGYGFQLWSPKGPGMGIVQISLDKVVQAAIDLYAAALTPSAAVFTLTNVPLGLHRVTLNPTNTKNASSSGFIVAADAIQVMR
ncbi:MAG TPA: hypothetical protein VI636_09350 [Candidatus Angelobacter sp.]